MAGRRFFSETITKFEAAQIGVVDAASLCAEALSAFNTDRLVRSIPETAANIDAMF